MIRQRSTGYVCAVLLFIVGNAGFAKPDRFIENPNANNVAVVVGASNGLPGIDDDLDHMSEILKGTYEFEITRLGDGKSSVANIEEELTRNAELADWYGTLFFYFSGHGSPGLIIADKFTEMKVQQIRDAIQKGREKAGPLARLILVYDSCYSGSMMDPMRIGYFWKLQDPAVMSALMADSIADVFTRANVSRDGDPYWQKLFVFASSQSDETSLAGDEGSVFTNAFAKAFKETASSDGSVGEFIAKTKQYTQGHHPVTRLVPNTVADEKLIPRF